MSLYQTSSQPQQSALGFNGAFAIRARVEGLRDFGACQNPFGSFLLLQVRVSLTLRGFCLPCFIFPNQMKVAHHYLCSYITTHKGPGDSLLANRTHHTQRHAPRLLAADPFEVNFVFALLCVFAWDLFERISLSHSIAPTSRTHQFMFPFPLRHSYITNFSVAWVRYPGLPEHESHERAKQYFRPGLFGPVLSFGVKGGREGEVKDVWMDTSVCMLLYERV